ncbi:hypothetical protein AGDE_10432 [Angomonas deanei]|nr:hypothetical protein AGDE_10432 [Angomonas deanei]|eukprot:EPY28337.1 hypothetical protein AGDE_10432 [Angomonas deanei]
MEEASTHDALYFSFYLRRELSILSEGEDTRETPEEVILIPSCDTSVDLHNWKCTVRVVNTESPWRGAVFVVDITLPSNYPFAPPLVELAHPLMSHPLIKKKNHDPDDHTHTIPFDVYYMQSVDPLRVSVLGSLKWYLGAFFSAPSAWSVFCKHAVEVDVQLAYMDVTRYSVLQQIACGTATAEASPYVRDLLQKEALSFFLGAALESDSDDVDSFYFKESDAQAENANISLHVEEPPVTFEEWFTTDFLPKSRSYI